MALTFLSLPSEIRNEIYGLLLLHQSSIRPWGDRCLPQQTRTPGLFRANKTVHREATPLFYGQNRFDFTLGHVGIASFLEKIGRDNAGYIRHNISLEYESVRFLTKIQSHCTNLGVITVPFPRIYDLDFALGRLGNPKIVTEVLKLVDTSFRAGSSLQEIVLEVDERDSDDFMRSEMKSLGWTLTVVRG
jgi:hypothetical protein